MAQKKQVPPSRLGNMTRRQRFEMLRAQLYNERSSFMSHWKDLGSFIQPRRPRFFTQDNDQGQARNGSIVDSTATLAIRTTKSGMMGGITSPARRWFKLTTPTPEDQQSPAVKQWLYILNERMSVIFGKSNLYNSLPTLYGDMANFATGAMLVEEDLDDVLRTYVYPIGSYCIGTNSKGKVNIFYREFQMTVHQMLDMFGKKKEDGKTLDWENFNWENFSVMFRDFVEKNQLQFKLDVCHMIVPNDEYEQGKLGWKGKRFSSHYYEKGVTTNDQLSANGPDADIFLREAGYDLFPVLAPRWEITGEDQYGTDCPAMTCLGDVKQLQVMCRRKSQAIEKMVNPPMQGPTSLRNTKTSLLPGDLTYHDTRSGDLGFRPVHEVRFQLSELMEDIRAIQQRIDKSFYVDLFLAFANDQRTGNPITATEVNEIHEEKLLALGPVLEQLNGDVLDPLIDLTFSYMVKQRLVPPAPPEMHGMPLRVEYTSIMAQAQKLLGISSTERFTGWLTSIINVIPNAADCVNGDEMVLDYGDKTSIAPKALRSPEEIQQIRAQRQQAQAQQMKAQQIAQNAQSAKNLSQADTSGDNALTQLMKQGQAGNAVPQR